MPVRRAVSALATVATILAGCGGFGGGLTGPAAHVTNGTAVPAVVTVNGGWVGTYPSGASVDVPLGGHGGPPYRIVVRTPTGASLAAFDITAADVAAASSGTGIGGSATSDCGTVDFAFGAAGKRPEAAPAAIPDPAACP